MITIRHVLACSGTYIVVHISRVGQMHMAVTRAKKKIAHHTVSSMARLQLQVASRVLLCISEFLSIDLEPFLLVLTNGSFNKCQSFEPEA